MAQAAFLVAMVGPRVGAAAAQAALATLTQKYPGPWLAATAGIVIDPSWRPPPSAVQLPVRLPLADSEVRSPSVGNQPTTVAGSPDGGISVSGQEIGMDVKPVGAGITGTIVNGQSDIVEKVLATACVKRAATTAMAAAAVKAKLLADQEEREIQRLVTIVIEHQLKKVELKLKTFYDLEIMLSKECESVERARQKIHSEHARMVATRPGTPPAGSAIPPIHGAGMQLQSPSTGSRQAGYASYAPGGQATQTITPGPASNSQGKNLLGSGALLSMQGFASPVAVGAMTARPQGELLRPRMMGGVPSHFVRPTAVPHSTLGRPS